MVVKFENKDCLSEVSSGEIQEGYTVDEKGDDDIFGYYFDDSRHNGRRTFTTSLTIARKYDVDYIEEQERKKRRRMKRRKKDLGYDSDDDVKE